MGLHHLRALQALYFYGDISRQAVESARGQLLSARNEAEMELIMRNLIKNVGKRHKRARKEG